MAALPAVGRRCSWNVRQQGTGGTSIRRPVKEDGNRNLCREEAAWPEIVFDEDNETMFRSVVVFVG